MGKVHMADEKPDILVVGAPKPVVVNGLAPACTLHRLSAAKDRDSFLAGIADKVRGIAVTYMVDGINGEFMTRFPKLEIVSTFGVGYDHVDAAWAGRHGIVVTNTPEVLTEEVADTAIGLLLCTVRELLPAERYLRAGKWPERAYPLTRATLRNRTSAWSAWAASARRSRAGSTPSACRWSTTRAIRSRA
jgi:lactate dehydrogenase-like 2-hydroxyacid dehydrogenase